MSSLLHQFSDMQQPVNNPSNNQDEDQKGSLTTKFTRSSNLEVTWVVKLAGNESGEITSKSFLHLAIQNKIWWLTLTTKDTPTLVLEWKDRQPVAVHHQSAMTQVREFLHEQQRGRQLPFSDPLIDDTLTPPVMVTSVFGGILVEQKLDFQNKMTLIPILGQLKSEIEFKLQIRLIRDNYDASEREVLAQLLNSSEPHDITFKSNDGQAVTAHRFVMAALSPFVKARFLHDGIQNTVFETNFEVQHLKLWIDHIYCRSLISGETKLGIIMDIFMVSDYFGTEIVSKLCRQLVIERLSPVNLVTVLMHDMVQLSGGAKDVLEALFQLTDEVSLTELYAITDQSVPQVAEFIMRVADRREKDESISNFE